MVVALLPHQRFRRQRPRKRLRKAIITRVSFEVPDAPGSQPRRAVIAFAELEVPADPRRSAVVSHSELEIPVAARAARLTFAELEVPDVGLRFGAFARREVTSSVAWMGSTGALSNIATVMFRWRNYETAEGVYSSTIENNLKASIDDAHGKGYKIVLRVFAGSDAPCGRPSLGGYPDWMLSGGHPVEVIETKALDSGGGSQAGDLIHVPLAWDENYRYHYRRLLSRLWLILDSNDAGGDKRSSHILFVPAAMPTELGTEMAIGYGSIDPTFNRAAWNAVSTETERRALYTQAWKDCIDDHRELLPNVRTGLAGQHLFNDGMAGADDIIQAKGGPDLVCMTTDLRPDYASWGANQHDFMLKGKAAGCFMGIQTAGESANPQGQGFVDSAEFALTNYDIHFFETYTTAFTSTVERNLAASGDWPGANGITTKQYLVGHASDLQSRLVP